MQSSKVVNKHFTIADLSYLTLWEYDGINRSSVINTIDHGCAIVGIGCCLLFFILISIYLFILARKCIRDKRYTWENATHIMAEWKTCLRSLHTVIKNCNVNYNSRHDDDNDSDNSNFLCDATTTQLHFTEQDESEHNVNDSNESNNNKDEFTTSAWNHGVTHLAVIMDGNRRYGRRCVMEHEVVQSESTIHSQSSPHHINNEPNHTNYKINNNSDNSGEYRENDSTSKNISLQALCHEVLYDSPVVANSTFNKVVESWFNQGQFQFFLSLIRNTAFDGHRRGGEKLLEFIDYCIECNIPMLTVYAFSTENWNRPLLEVNVLMTLFIFFFEKIRITAREKGICIRFIVTNPSSLPIKVLRLMMSVEHESRCIRPRRITVNVCVSYGGKDEIVTACNRLIQETLADTISTQALGAHNEKKLEISTSMLSREMLRSITEHSRHVNHYNVQSHNVNESTHVLENKGKDSNSGNALPTANHVMMQCSKSEKDVSNDDVFGYSISREPELLLRTGGEHRLSNFLLYECGYSEFIFIDKTWPEVNRQDLVNVLKEFVRRERRHGR